MLLFFGLSGRPLIWEGGRGRDLPSRLGSSRMIVPRRPAASSPGPRGPDEFSPMGRSCRSAARTAAVMWPSCHRISSLTASGWSGWRVQRPWRCTRRHPGRARPYEGRLRLGLPLGRRRPLQVRSPHERRHRRRNVYGSPLRRPTRHEQTRVSERWHHGGGDPPELPPRTVPAPAPRKSAAHIATVRRSASLSVCGEPTPRSSHAFGAQALDAADRLPDGPQRPPTAS